MESIKTMIIKEIDDYEATNGSIGYDVKSNLVEPIAESYYTNDGHVFELITVFREGEDGYNIAYDPDDKLFCLGYKNKDEKLYYVGHYGSFMYTYICM